MGRYAITLLNLLFWVVAAFYVWGGMISGGKPKLTFVKDAFVGLAAIYVLMRLTGVRFRDTAFGRAWNELWRSFDLSGLSWPARVLTAFCAYLAVLFVALPIVNHYGYGNSAFDFGIFANSVFNGSRTGDFFTYLLIREDGPTSYFPHNRLDLGLWLFAPLYRVVAWPGLLLIAQSLALLGAMVPLYLLGDRVLPKAIPRWAPLVAYWFFDPIHRMNLWDWHETPFLIPFCLWAFYFIEVGRLKAALASLLLMAIWREDAWWIFSAMAVYAGVRTRKWKLCLPAALLGFAVFPFHVAVLNQVNTVGERYPYLGPDLRSAIAVVLERPWVFFQVGWENKEFFGRLLLFAGGPIFLLSGWALLPLLVPLAEVGLSKWDGMLGWHNHYIGLFAGPLFATWIFGWRRAYPWLERRLGESKAMAVLGMSLALSMSQLAVSEPGGMTRARASQGYADCLDRLRRHVPDGAPVLATDPFAARLTNREFLSLPFRWIHLSEEEWRKVDQTRAEWLLSNDRAHLQVGMSPSTSPWEIVEEDCGFFVARRSASAH